MILVTSILESANTQIPVAPLAILVLHNSARWLLVTPCAIVYTTISLVQPLICAILKYAWPAVNVDRIQMPPFQTLDVTMVTLAPQIVVLSFKEKLNANMLRKILAQHPMHACLPTAQELELHLCAHQPISLPLFPRVVFVKVSMQIATLLPLLKSAVQVLEQELWQPLSLLPSLLWPCWHSFLARDTKHT